MSIEKRLEKLEAAAKPKDKRDPVIVQVIKWHSDDKITSTYLVDGKGELSESEFNRLYPDYEDDSGADEIYLDWGE